MKKSFSRRNFLMGSGILAAASSLGLAGSAVALDTPKPVFGVPEKWDYEADIAIIGAGAAGLSTAIEAYDQGLSAIIVESQSVSGGSSKICNGGIAMCGTPIQEQAGIEDSVDLMYEDLVTITSGDNQPELIRRHCEGAAELYDWLTGFGIEFRVESLIGTQGASVNREHHVDPFLVVQTLEAEALARGAEIIFETHADALIQNPETGEVLGFSATAADGSTIYVKGRRATALCSNGYSRNPDMLREYVFGMDQPNLAIGSGPGDDGSGILMAQKIGAKTRHMRYVAALTGKNPDGGITNQASFMNLGAVMVNKEGERFVDESRGYANVWTFVAEQTDGVCYQVWDDALAQQYEENDSLLYSMKKVRDSGLLIEADTLEELAEKMGIPADTFVATMDTYNSDIAKDGVDSVFGRAHLVATNGEPLQLTTPPFYAWYTTNVLNGTFGGLDQDYECHVIDVYGEPIPRLFCAGEITQYAMFGCVPLTSRANIPSGCGFGGAMIHGRYIAQENVDIEPWD